MEKLIEPNVDLPRLAQQAQQHFAEQFGRPPTSMVAAPGRVNMIGDHVDYTGGIVLPFAIDRYTVIAMDLVVDSTSSLITVNSVGQSDSFVIDLAEPIVRLDRHWSNYVKGVVHGFIQRGFAIPPMDMLVHSSVPTGSGLSSSAALEVATATAIEVACDTNIASQAKALLCQTAEHDFARVPCGVMDQFISVFGRADLMLQIDCQDLSTVYVPFDSNQLALLVINSNVQHELAAGEYALRRQTCESVASLLGLDSLRELVSEDVESKRPQLTEIQYRRARHVVTENQRTLAFVETISDGRFAEAGQILYESHASLRDDYEVSCAELDQLVELALSMGEQGGVYGARMTGGGFGGSVIVMVRKDAAESVAAHVVSAFNQTRQAGQKPASAFVTQPSKGAHVLV